MLQDQGTRDLVAGARKDDAHDERLHELAGLLRNLLATTVVAVAAIKDGRVGFNGATGAALDRSLRGMRDVIDRVLRESSPVGSSLESIEMGAFVLDVQFDATMSAAGTSQVLSVAPVEAGLWVEADRYALACVVGNLLRDAFASDSKDVVLRAYAHEGRAVIEVESECWDPSVHWRDESDSHTARARERIVADGARLFVRPGVGAGSLFTIELPRKAVPGG